MPPIDVACGECAAQPTEACKPDPPIDPDVGYHPARIDEANFIGGVESRAAGEQAVAISDEQFDQAVTATGDV